MRTDKTLRVQLRMVFDIPSAEGKPLYGNLDVPEVSLSTKPKYDPCRKLRKGDIVEPCQVKGRWHSVVWEGRSGIHFTVTEDEDEDGIVSIKDPDCKLPYNAAAVFFNLVTPVEEVEPYTVVESYGRTDIMKDDCVITTYTDSHPHAKKSAEDECDRLNAEYRNKQSND